MAVHGQRWRFQLENTRVDVDNAFTWAGWGQERVTVNEEILLSKGQWFGFRLTLREPWLTRTGEGELSVQLIASLMAVSCKLELDGEAILPDERFEAAWADRKTWPSEELWKPTQTFTVFGTAAK